MMYPKRLLWIAGLVFTVFAMLPSTATKAQSVEIGYTDPNMIVAQMPEYRDVLQEMQTLYQGGQQELQQMMQEFQTKLQEYQERQALMSEEAKQKKEQELQSLQQKIQQFRAQKEQEMGQKEQELVQPLLKKVQGAIDEVSKEQGLDLVLSTQAANSSVVLYASESTVDITEPVMKRLGIDPSKAQNPAPTPTPPTSPLNNN